MTTQASSARKPRVYLSLKLGLPFLIMIIVIASVVGYMVWSSYQLQVQYAQERQRQASRQAALQISSYVSQFRAQLEDAARGLVYAGTDPKQQRDLLERVQSAHRHFYDLSVTDSSGQETARKIWLMPEYRTPLQLRADEPVVQEALGGRFYLGWVNISKEYKSPFVEMSVPVYDAGGSITGALLAKVDLTYLWVVVRDVQAGQNGYAYVIDEANRLIAYRESRKVQKPLFNIEKVPAVSNHLKKERSESASITEYPAGLACILDTMLSVNGKDCPPVLAYYRPIEGTRWGIIIEQPVNDAYAEADKFQTLALSLGAIIMITAVGLWWSLQRDVLRPVRLLSEGVAALGSGQLTRDITIHTGDEIELLANEFNTMAESLQRSQKQLETFALEKGRQAEIAQKRVQEMRALLESGRAITSLDLENVLDSLASEAARTVGADQCLIYLKDEHSDQLVTRGAWGLGEVEYVTVPLSWGESAAGWVARERHDLFLSNAQTDERFVSKTPADHLLSSLLAMPLILNGEVIGVLQVAARSGSTGLSVNEKRLIEPFAHQATVAYENAQLYEEERRRAREMKVVAEIMRTISTSLNLDETLNLILQSVRELIPYDESEINLWEAHQKVLRTQGWTGGEKPPASEGIYGLDEGFTGWMARHHQPILVADIQTESQVLPKVDLDKFPFRSFIGVPLLLGDDLVGTLELACYAPDTFNARHLETLQTIANQASVAIQNARLYEETRRVAEEMAALREAAVEISSHLESERILHAIVKRAATLLRGQGGVIYQVDAEKQNLTVIVSYNMPQDVTGVTIRFGEGLSGRIAQARQPMIVNDYQNWEGRSERYAGIPVTAIIGVPLIWQDKLVGVLNILSDAEQRKFDDNDLRLITLFAGQAAVALQNASLYEQVMRRVKELNTLTSIGQALSSTLREDELLQLIYEQTRRVMYAENLFIALYDQEHHEVEFAFSRNPDEIAPGTRRPANEGLVGYIIKHRKSILMKSDATEIAEQMGVKQGLPATSWLGVPMLIGERALGVIAVQHYTDPNVYDESHRTLLETIASQAAFALDNARLYQLTDVRLQQRVKELTGLATISQELNATHHLPQIFDLVLNEAIRATSAQYGTIHLWNTKTNDLEVRAAYGYQPDEAQAIAGARPQYGVGIIGHVVASGEVAAVDDVSLDPNYLRVLPDTRSELCVPVSYAGSVAGAINLESTELTHFTPDHIEYLQALASQAAIAIGNAQHYEEQLQRGEMLHRRVEQLATLFKISQTFRSDQPVEDTLEEVAYAIQNTVGFDIVMISVVEGNPPMGRRVAAAGIPIAEFEQLKTVRQPWSIIQDVMLNEFRISQSYYIPAEKREARAALHVYDSVKGTHERQSDQWHPQDLLFVPLYGAQERVLGWVSVDNPRDGAAPNRATIETLEVFANQAAVAIENTRLYADLQRRINELSLLNEFGRSITSLLDLESLLETVVESAAKLLDSTYATIFLFEEPENLLVPRKTYGFELDKITHVRFPPGQGLVGWVAAKKQGVIVSDTSNDPRFVPDPVSAEVRSAVVAPLLIGEQIVGAISADKPEANGFTETDLVLLSTLGDQAAVAIQNARLYEELEQRVAARTEDLRQALDQLTLERDRVETLFRITSELQASLDLDRVLNRALTLANENIHASRAVIMLIDLQSDTLVCRAAIDPDLIIPPGGIPTRLWRNDGLAGWSIRRRKSLIVPDVRDDPYWSPEEDGAKGNARSALVVPLIVADEVLGALLMTHLEVGYFDESHLRLVEAAASQVATAINNAELYRMIRESAERLGQMLRTQQEEASKSQAILEAVADGVMVADRHARVILFNAAAERILGLKRDEVIGRSTDDLLGLYGAGGAAWTNVVREWATSARTRSQTPSLEQQLQIEERHVRTNVAPVTMGDEYLGTVSVFRDVTKEVEVDRAKNDFVSTVSHELRTPMTSIKGYADLLLLGAAGKMSKEQIRFLDIIKSNADRLSELVNDLLNISRIEAGRVELDIKPLRLDSLIEQVVTSLRGKIEEKDLTIFTDIHPDLPAVKADKDRVIQILTNLISNAYQYTRPGGTITVRAKFNGTTIQTDVADTGVGISPEDQAKVFDRFFRSEDDYIQEFAGTGLGLAIVKQLIEMHKGEIWLESEVGVGTTFSFTLPAVNETT